MARLRYYPTPADFAVGFGESVPLLDADGVTPISGNPTGRLAAVPEASVSFQVCTTADIADVTTDLLDGAGDPITVWSTSTDFVTLGRGPILQGPDEHVGPLYLTPDAGTTFYRIEPDSTGLYGRVGDVETAVSTMATDDLVNFADTAPTNGQVPIFNTSTGLWEPGAAPGTGTVTTVAGVAPISGDVPLTRDDLGAADDAVVEQIADNFVYLLIGDASGYPAALPIGKPMRAGPVDPGPDAIGKLWLQPVVNP